MIFHPVEEAFKEAVAQGIFPGAVVLVGKGDEVVFERAFGHRSLVPEKSPMQLETIFDLASLTKPLATTIATMLLVREKKIRLEDRVTRFFPNFGVFGKTHVTFRHLLAHCSGLPAWKPYYEDIVKGERDGKINFIASRAAKSYVFELIHREKSLGPPGTQSLYSDLGFMLLGEGIEEVTGWTLDRSFQDKIFKPMGLRSTSFVDLTLLRTRRLQPVAEMIAPTEQCPWRKKVLCGEEPFLPAPVVKEFLARDETVKGSTYTLGWDTPSPESSASGSHFSPNSVGHLGFTGTSVWWDMEKDCHIVLLSNRIHPSRNNDKIKAFRPYVHDLI